MNKRILKLFNEAGFHQPEMERLGIEHKFQKFAELIVRECAGVELYWLSEQDRKAVAEKIKEHFGVE